MKKFTKEISALLASVVVGAGACAGAVTASSAQTDTSVPDSGNAETTLEVPMIGTMTQEETTTFMTEAFSEEDVVGLMMPGEPDVVETDLTEPIGTMMAEETTEPTFEPEPVGTMMPEETTEPTSEPELVGTMMPEETTIPPLLGDVAPADGDIDGDGELGVTDVVMFQKWLLGAPDIKFSYSWNADLYPDGVLDVFDLSLMKRRLVDRNGS